MEVLGMSSSGSAKNYVKNEIFKRIRNNIYNEDTIISESKLCEELNVSRTPVREALIHLSASHLLEKVPQKGYRVKEFDLKTKLDTYYVISILDANAAMLSLDNLNDEDYLLMNEFIDLMDIDIKYHKFDKYNEHQESFHHVYIDKCGNDALIRILEQVKSSIPTYLYHSSEADRLFPVLAKLNEEHREILNLIKDKKSMELRNFLINNHWQTAHMDMI